MQTWTTQSDFIWNWEIMKMGYSCDSASKGPWPCNNLGLIAGTHTVKGETQFVLVVFWLSHVHQGMFLQTNKQTK